MCSREDNDGYNKQEEGDSRPCISNCWLLGCRNKPPTGCCRQNSGGCMNNYGRNSSPSGCQGKADQQQQQQQQQQLQQQQQQKKQGYQVPQQKNS